MLSKERDENGRPMGFLTRREARAQKRAEEEAYWDEARKSQGSVETEDRNTGVEDRDSSLL